MTTFNIQYAVAIHLENPFPWDSYIAGERQIDDGVRLSARNRVKVFLVSCIKSSLLKININSLNIILVTEKKHR